MDPTNPDVIYAGTGEGYFNGDAARGLGIFRTTDGGANWARLPGTDNPNFYYVNDLVISPTGGERLYAATSTGVWRSSDRGASWARVLTPVASGQPVNGGCLDLAIRSDQPADHVFAACGTFAQGRIYRNTDAGGESTWTEVFTEPGMGRTALAIAPSNQEIVYAISTAYLAGPFQSALHAVFRSAGGGAPGTWAASVRNSDPVKLNASLLSIPISAFGTDCGYAPGNSFSGQGVV